MEDSLISLRRPIKHFVTKEQIELAYKNAKRSDKAAKLIGISPTHFKRLMHKYNISFLSRKEQLGRRRQWFPLASKTLSYVLGVLIGDGHVTGQRNDRGNSFRIILQVTNFEFANKFKNALLDIGLVSGNIKIHFCRRLNRKPIFITKASSRMFSDWYLNLKLDDIKQVIKNHEPEFICGLWESEGHIIPENNHFDVTIGMTRKDIIDLIAEIMQSWNLSPKKQGPYKDRRGHKDIYRVSLHKKLETAKFIEIINPCFKRGTNNDHKYKLEKII